MMRVACHRDTRPHLHPPVLRPRAARGEQVARCSPAARCCSASTGRPDLLGHDHTHDLVHHQYASAHRLAHELPEQAQVLPTHGFGAFCSAGSTGDATASTIGAGEAPQPGPDPGRGGVGRRDARRAGRLPGLLRAHGPGQHRRPRRAGPVRPGGRRQGDPRARRIASGEWVVDLRTRTAFAAGHVTGTLNFGLDGQFATYLGWLIPWGTPLTLLGESPEQVAEAQRELVRIGIDRLAAPPPAPRHEWTDGPLGTLRAGHVRRPRPGPPPPRRSPSWTSAAPPSAPSRTSTAR